MLDSVLNYLLPILAPNYNATGNPDDVNVANFLTELMNSDFNSKRLLVCLGIDIKVSYKVYGVTNNSNKFIEAIRTCILGTFGNFTKLKSFGGIVPPHVRFGFAQRKLGVNFHSPCIGCAQCPENYSRVTLFINYVLYVVRLNLGYNMNPHIERNIDPNQIDIYYNEFARFKNNRFHAVKITKHSSNSGWIFVTALNDLLNHPNDPDSSKNISDILDGLGFYMENLSDKDGYVRYDYPLDFSEHNYQPDSLTGDWGTINANKLKSGNEFFLSFYQKNDWGKTFSITGNSDSFRERTHREFDYGGQKGYDIKAYSHGKFTKKLTRLPEDAIINEALDRFMRA